MFLIAVPVYLRVCLSVQNETSVFVLRDGVKQITSGNIGTRLTGQFPVKLPVFIPA